MLLSPFIIDRWRVCMVFSQKAINQIAHLARLEIKNTSNGHSIQDDLTRIVAMIDQIQGINTQGIEPMSHPLEDNSLPSEVGENSETNTPSGSNTQKEITAQRTRPDLVTEPNQRDTLLTLAPLAEAGLYLVPQVIEE